ncbi:MAG TPA: TonB-dependent receptor [Prolixibacteraceae bacterium]|nr:TonB-dependent receptor [Prolixibacteraceae bacterium]
MKSKQILLYLLIFLSMGAWAQKKITGRVTDSSTSETLPGVNVLVKGYNTIGTVTDIDGRFTLTVPNEKSILTFSFIGFTPQDVIVGKQSAINVQLKMLVMGLDEVVVIGYGTMKKSDLSGSSVSVSEANVKGSINSGLDQALQGRAAGVTAVQTSGQPGSSSSIRIRGTSTLNADAEPLYVIDGVPISSSLGSVYDVGLGAAGGGGKTSFSALSSINPSDIVSMEILKDASSTAIYGSRGANGVVLITTRRGKANEAKFTYETMYGVQTQVKRLEVMNLREFAQYQNDLAAETNGKVPRVDFSDPSLLGVGTNWQNEIFRTAAMQSHNVTATGGSASTQYSLSGGYFQQDGTVIGSEFKRYSFRTNIDTEMKKWLKVGTSLMISNTEDYVGLFDQTGGIIQTAAKQTPDVPVRNFDGTYATAVGEGATSRVNPIAKALDEENRMVRTRLMGNIYGQVNIMKGLTFRTEIGGDLGYTNGYHFSPTFKYGTQANDQNSASKRYNQNMFWQFKNYVTYNFKFLENNNVTAMLGQEASEWTYENLSGESKSLPTNDIHEPGLGDIKSMSVGSGRGSGAMNSYYTRLNYNFKEKYFLTFTYRGDGSSNFGPNNRWAYFPSAAGSWRFSDEAFMSSLKNVVTNAKLRLGWGQTGNQNIGGYRWGSALAKLPTNLGAGFRVSNFANPNLMWETSEQTNLGLDLSFFKSRIDLTVDAYLKSSKDMLMPMQLPSYMGTSGNPAFNMKAPWGNFGEIENKGLEISLSTQNFTKEFKWNTDISLTFNRNKLVNIGTSDAKLYGYAQWFDLVTVTEAGQPLGNFYGYKVAGIYKDKQDILDSPKPAAYKVDASGNPVFNRDNTVFPGDIKFQDISGPDGVPDGIIDEKDRTNLGSSQPKFSYGMTNTFTYKGVELTVFVMGQYGNKLFNYFGRNISDMKSQWDNQLKTVTERAKLEVIDATVTYPSNGYNNWFEDINNVRVANPGTTIPRSHWADPNQNTRISDRYIEDGSFLRIKNVTLGYNIPASFISRYGIQALKVYTNIQNLYTFTKYTGFDPEIGQDTLDPYVTGLDNGRYPSPRIISFGLNITF